MTREQHPRRAAAADPPLDAPEWAGWAPLLRKFWTCRAQSTAAFRRFVVDWQLGEFLGLEDQKISNTGDVGAEANPHHRDRKVLGYHRFTAIRDVDDYVFRWSRNPQIHDTCLWQHRFIVSRGIDLICSELISNGFEHSGVEKPDVFVMAKLCSVESARISIDLEKKSPHLSGPERRFFTQADELSRPVLQLCIGNRGTGFGGNKKLNEAYASRHSLTSEPDEAELVRFSVTGLVSTKTRAEKHHFWKRQLDCDETLTPTTHGLAEVMRFVRRMRGYWRIHTNDCVLDYDCLDLSLATTPASKSGRPGDALCIPGVLHYFMIPLFFDEHLPALSSPSENRVSQGLELIDAADDALVHGNVPAAESETSNWVDSFCERVLERSRRSKSPLLLHLGVLDQVDDQNLEAVCIDIIRCLHAVRDDAAVVLSGTNEATRSLLSRYIASPAFNLAYRILPFLDLQAHENTMGLLSLGCSELLRGVSQRLSDLLESAGSYELLRSDVGEDTWATLCRVETENRLLFQSEPIGRGSDCAFRARLQVSLKDALCAHLLYGGSTEAEIQVELKRQAAVLPEGTGPFYRRGKILSTYLHAGKLWADPEFQSRVINWFRIAHYRAALSSSSVRRGGDDIVVIAYLHPAIELAREILRSGSYGDCELIEIRRVADLRWDYEPLVRSRASQIVSVMDVVLTGSAANRVSEIAEYLGKKHVACFSILAHRSASCVAPLFAFCDYSG